MYKPLSKEKIMLHNLDNLSVDQLQTLKVQVEAYSTTCGMNDYFKTLEFLKKLDAKLEEMLTPSNNEFDDFLASLRS